MGVTDRSGSEGDVVAIEWVAVIAMLLLPVVVLVATMPGWAERKHAATVAAREAARDLVDNWPNGNPESATLVAIAWPPITASMRQMSTSACLR